MTPAHGPRPAATPPANRPPGPSRAAGGALELLIDKSIDFALIFVGLYAATALQRWQDTQREKQEYVELLQDFRRELDANVEQEASIAKDLGPIDQSAPGDNLGPMQTTFDRFFATLAKDEKVAKCLHAQFAAAKGPDAADEDHDAEACAALYEAFEADHQGKGESFEFKPAVLTPFYRKEVWQLYLADGVKTFRNKALAVDIAEVYANAELIEEQVEDIERTYNEAFMKQVARSAATDMELAQVVHDEEVHHALSAHDLALLLDAEEALKQEHYAALEAQRELELKVERMKQTVLVMREEIEAVQAAIEAELRAQGASAGEDNT